MPSRADAKSEQFQANRDGNLELIERFNEQLALAREGGGEEKVQRHYDRGKLMIRKRIELLLDRDSAFLELSPLIGWGSDFKVGGSTVQGIGVVNGVECLIGGADPTVKGGAGCPPR
ncbi:MAG: hypothetical protein KY469_20960 [Actinobacteria bacterium]|nr:hypothetical protein [Actinomycetota bacterium]